MTTKNETIGRNVANLSSEELEMKRLYFFHKPTFTIGALVALAHLIYKSRLNSVFRIGAFACCDYLYEKLGFTTDQAVVVAIAFRLNHPITIAAIADFLDLPIEKVKRFENDIDELVQKGMLTRCKLQNDNTASYVIDEGFKGAVQMLKV